jgi:hypothetical protein
MSLTPVTDLKYFQAVRQCSGNTRKQMNHIYRQVDIYRILIYTLTISNIVVAFAIGYTYKINLKSTVAKEASCSVLIEYSVGDTCSFSITKGHSILLRDLC